MRCIRCNGLMVDAGVIWDAAIHAPDEALPALWEAGDRQLSRCVNCGHVTDPVMEANRRALTPHTVWQQWTGVPTRCTPGRRTRVADGEGSEIPTVRCQREALSTVLATELPVIWETE
jgi:hypothetical protein